ncbi:von Willebrand factor type A (plasmid) [Stanieria cyanosphaera PCC 7437]|uniref:von Willebrand factor type A n=1 Tax=Stanieria cyanosphaera (strain ATCC 29371 / PCC 7437) TaxID=111780 RepID=K9XZT2_STAC7|nr:VWA domain-containing protein [Stanieria cyanosphaera]AFZ38038.1 von Willebrand factor type A [Stanieria cyanosphaera PCC 7437]
MNKKHLKITRWLLYFVVTLLLCLSSLWACSPDTKQVLLSPSDTITQINKLVDNITVNPSPLPEILPISDTPAITEPIPNLENYPVYGAKNTNNVDVIPLEIYSSPEKANPDSSTEDFLIEAVDEFNAQNQTIDGQKIEVSIRSIPSGAGARLIAAGATKPNAYSPSNSLWLSMLQAQGIDFKTIAPQLVPNTAGLVLSESAYQKLAKDGEVTFDRVLDGILAGNLTVGYANPYESSTAINLLYSTFWRGAGHHLDGKPLTKSDLNSQPVNSVFETFQNRVLVTTTTTLDLLEIYQREPDKLDAFPLEYQNYLNLKQQPEFKNLHFVSFGVAHDNPLVTFSWNSPEQEAALTKFTQFVLSTKMQQLATKDSFVPVQNAATDSPPQPNGEILLAAQKYWKQRKDLGRTVYMELVVDVSGSLEGEPINSLKEALRVATTEINPGNEIGLISFADTPTRIVDLNAFDQNQQQRLLAGIDSLQAVGSTAIYDGLVVGLADLLAKKERDPNGIFYLLLLSDGDRTTGLEFDRIRDVVANAGVRILPIAYGEVNYQELEAIAAFSETTVKDGNPDNVKELMHQIFQTQM